MPRLGSRDAGVSSPRDAFTAIPPAVPDAIAGGVQSLETKSGTVDVQPEDIVDGDRERTLSLLWAAAFQLQVPPLYLTRE